MILFSSIDLVYAFVTYVRNKIRRRQCRVVVVCPPPSFDFVHCFCKVSCAWRALLTYFGFSCCISAVNSLLLYLCTVQNTVGTHKTMGKNEKCYTKKGNYFHFFSSFFFSMCKIKTLLFSELGQRSSSNI